MSAECKADSDICPAVSLPTKFRSCRSRASGKFDFRFIPKSKLCRLSGVCDAQCEAIEFFSINHVRSSFRHGGQTRAKNFSNRSAIFVSSRLPLLCFEIEFATSGTTSADISDDSTKVVLLIVCVGLSEGTTFASRV